LTPNFETFSKSAVEEGPEALVHDYHALIYELNKRKKIDNYCKLVTRGPAVNPSGIALAFPHGTDMHIPFSKAILNILAQDGITSILRSLSFLLMMRQFLASFMAFFVLALFRGKILNFFSCLARTNKLISSRTLERHVGIDSILLR
jgi:hypothetical protein